MTGKGRKGKIPKAQIAHCFGFLGCKTELCTISENRTSRGMLYASLSPDCLCWKKDLR